MQRYHLGELDQALASLARRGVEPHIVVCIARRSHRGVDVLFGPLRPLCDDLAGGRVDDLLVFASRAGPPLAADEHLPSLQRRAHFLLLAGTSATSASAEPRMSRPSVSWSSGMVSGMRVRMTLWCMPERKSSRQRSRASARMPGVTRECSMAKNLPVRPKPVWISSAIRRIPYFSVILRSSRRKGMGAGTNPPSPRTGSMMIAATRCGETADSKRVSSAASACSELQPRYS